MDRCVTWAGRLAASVFLASLLCARTPAAEEKVGQVLPEKEVTAERLVGLFRDAMIKCDIDKDGDIRIEESGVKTFIRLDANKKLITFFSLWAMKEQVPREKKLELINTLNNDLIVVRFCAPKPDILWCDYQMSYEDGLHTYHLVATYRLFLRVVIGAKLAKDPDNIIGRD